MSKKMKRIIPRYFIPQSSSIPITGVPDYHHGVPLFVDLVTKCMPLAYQMLTLPTTGDSSPASYGTKEGMREVVLRAMAIADALMDELYPQLRDSDAAVDEREQLREWPQREVVVSKLNSAITDLQGITVYKTSQKDFDHVMKGLRTFLNQIKRVS